MAASASIPAIDIRNHPNSSQIQKLQSKTLKSSSRSSFLYLVKATHQSTPTAHCEQEGRGEGGSGGENRGTMEGIGPEEWDGTTCANGQRLAATARVHKRRGGAAAPREEADSWAGPVATPARVGRGGRVERRCVRTDDGVAETGGSSRGRASGAQEKEGTHLCLESNGARPWRPACWSPWTSAPWAGAP